MSSTITNHYLLILVAHIKSDQLSRYLTAWLNNLSDLDKQIQVIDYNS